MRKEIFLFFFSRNNRHFAETEKLEIEENFYQLGQHFARKIFISRKLTKLKNDDDADDLSDVWPSLLLDVSPKFHAKQSINNDKIIMIKIEINCIFFGEKYR